MHNLQRKNYDFLSKGGASFVLKKSNQSVEKERKGASSKKRRKKGRSARQ